MKKVTNLESYKHILLKREGDLKASKGLIDEDADYEDALFDCENYWDSRLDHGNLGFVQRQNSKPELFIYKVSFVNLFNIKKKTEKKH